MSDSVKKVIFSFECCAKICREGSKDKRLVTKTRDTKPRPSESVGRQRNERDPNLNLRRVEQGKVDETSENYWSSEHPDSTGWTINQWIFS